MMLCHGRFFCVMLCVGLQPKSGTPARRRPSHPGTLRPNLLCPIRAASERALNLGFEFLTH